MNILLFINSIVLNTNMAVKHEDLANFRILKNHLENKAKTNIRIGLPLWLRW